MFRLRVVGVQPHPCNSPGPRHGALGWEVARSRLLVHSVRNFELLPSKSSMVVGAGFQPICKTFKLHGASILWDSE